MNLRDSAHRFPYKADIYPMPAIRGLSMHPIRGYEVRKSNERERLSEPNDSEQYFLPVLIFEPDFIQCTGCKVRIRNLD